MKRTTTTVTLLPFAPHQQQHSSSWSQQRSPARSRLPSLLSASVCIMSAPSPSQLFDVSRRPNTLRISPSIISEASCDTTSSSSSSSSSSSFPSTSPTSYSTSPPSLPPSPPPPSNRSPGKSRPLPQPPAPTERSPFPNNAAAAAATGQLRPRTPPPAWSPPEPAPSFVAAAAAARPTRPRVALPQERQSSSESPRVPLISPRSTPAQLDGSASSLVQPRVRPLPTRPVPPGPPSEDNTPIAPFGLPRWQADALTIPQDDTSMSPYDDRHAIDWDLIDEVMKRAG